MVTSDGSSTACSAMIAMTLSLTLCAMTFPVFASGASLKDSGRT
jgi:biotin transporter BioY